MYILANKLNHMPGAYLTGHAAALANGLADSILPDPLAAKDLVRADPLAIAAVIRRRIYDDRLPRGRAILRYPKNFDAAAYRTATSLDIIDQCAYRHVVSPCAVASARQLPESVLSMRPVCDYNGVWHVGSPRSAWKLRQERILEELRARPGAHVLVMDVAQYYPSLTSGPLTLAMNSFGLSTGAVDETVNYLEALNGLPGTVGGIPIGPDASAVLGTAGLISVDRVLAREFYVRFADDVWVIAADYASAEAAAERVTEQLELIGLKENTSKRKILTGPEAIDHITDAEIDYIARPGNRASAGDAMDLICSGIAEQKLSRVRCGLGALKYHRSTVLVPMLVAAPSLIDAEPKAFGSYLGSVSRTSATATAKR